ncbi:CpxP family protein [Photobacterium sanguinicancri]|uniref:CpxP family protein n=1 Tax=Photobacterium sanguinicancri TaxID=875932 RepID=UPI003D0FDD67
MKSIKKTLVMAIVLPLALGSASAMAYGGGKGHHEGKGGCGMDGGKKMFRELDLTSEQKTQMKTLRESHREQRHANTDTRDVRKASHQQMQQLLLEDSFNEAEVRQLAQQMSEQQLDHRVAMLKNRHDMLNILTAEQKTKLQELQSERMAKCDARRDAKVN